METLLDRFKEAIEAAEHDYKKAKLLTSKAAAIRARKQMLVIRSITAEIREELMGDIKEMKELRDYSSSSSHSHSSNE